MEQTVVRTDERVTITAAAAEYGVEYDKLYEACRSGRLPVIKEPRGKRHRLLVAKSDVQAFIDATQKLPGDPMPDAGPPVEVGESDAGDVAGGADVPPTERVGDSREPPSAPDVAPRTAQRGTKRRGRKKPRRKTPMHLAKNSMRRFGAVQLVHIIGWANARIARMLAMRAAEDAKNWNRQMAE